MVPSPEEEILCTDCSRTTQHHSGKKLICSECGAKHDRDISAARNILAAGASTSSWRNPCYLNWALESFIHKIW
ncbi:zinc ribbon domain-containing protein [Oleiphilus messinensis]|uniref:zinc ribbon domain-containing protein n=1 Tax=Oleiphilus messinensis TaxID=141451 RepID=UPI0012F93653